MLCRIWYNLIMSREKFTREQLDSLDKDILITLLLGMQEQLAQQTFAIEKLTEQIALMNTRSFSRKSEKGLAVLRKSLMKSKVWFRSRLPWNRILMKS